VLASVLAAACSNGGDGSDEDAGEETPVTTPATPELSERDEPVPVVMPTPRAISWLGPDVTVPDTVTVLAATDVDAATLEAVVEGLQVAGAAEVSLAERAPRPDGAAGGDGDAAEDGGPGDRAAEDGALTVHVGSATDAELVGMLAEVGVEVPDDLPAEGYALATFARSDDTGAVVLAGTDPAGTFYAAQTLRQLADDATIAAVGVVDHPAMHHRGSIEGFYGSPWTTEERLDQLAFYGRYKLNTYIYAPKDDPYHRDRWRDPYPPDRLDHVRDLADAAAANHVRFTFAVSPGVSICYSDPADLAALTDKLAAVHAIGVRSFSIALDDIDHTVWHCEGDAARFGPPSTEAAARAQVELLNAVQDGFVADHEGVQPLQMVPTEYQGTRDSPYRTVLRDQLDPAVEVMWTGAYVVPDEITVAQAQAAAVAFGRPTYVWDNTPVNDFPPTEGRLILAPYARREPGLAAHVTGIVLNPMNQAAASKVQLIGGADFAWNDTGYDPAVAHRAAADDLAGGDPATTEALLAFFDLENLAPTSATSGIVSQPQAPVLAEQLATFRATWSEGDRGEAVDALRPYAEVIAGAPELIRTHVTDTAFVDDCAPWLDATALWGEALVATLDALAAEIAGDPDGAAAARATVDQLVAQAGEIETIPGETRPQGPVRVGDGVLDAFIAEAPGLA
jgi:hyaluronoglucosaminidase